MQLIYRRVVIGVWPSGKATDFDSVIRWFESSYPSHLFPDVPVAQVVEQLTFNQWVVRSIRIRDTIFY